MSLHESSVDKPRREHRFTQSQMPGYSLGRQTPATLSLLMLWTSAVRRWHGCCVDTWHSPSLGSSLEVLNQILAPSRDCFSPCGLWVHRVSEQSCAWQKHSPHQVPTPASGTSCHHYFARSKINVPIHKGDTCPFSCSLLGSGFTCALHGFTHTGGGVGGSILLILDEGVIQFGGEKMSI